MGLISEINATVDDDCEALGCEVKMPTPAESSEMVAGGDADKLEGKTLVDDNIDCDNDVVEVLVDNEAVDVATAETAEIAEVVVEVAAVPKTEGTTD